MKSCSTPDSQGQSNTVAVVAMVAVALLLVALTGVFLLSEGGQEEEPVFADIQVETTAEEFVVKHGGGDTVAPADLTLTTTGAAEGTVALDRFTATSNSFTAGEEIEIPTDEFDGVADNEWLLGEFGVAVTHEPTNSVFASNRGAVAIERLSVDAETADDDVSVLAGNREGAPASTVSLAVTASTNGPTTGVITHMLDRDNIDVSPSDRLQALDFAESEREVTVDIENSVSITVNFNGVSAGADLLTGEWAELALDVPETLEFGAQESGEYAVEATYDLYDSETVTGAASVAAANSSVVEIDGTNIVAVGSGTTEVTATYTDDEAGRLQTTETVTVEDPVESVSLDTGSGGLEFGDRETTDYEVTATFASGRTVDVTDEASVTSNAGVVTVDETANTLQAVEAGEATLTATYNEVSDETSLGVTDPLADINLTVPTPLEVSETAGYEVNATFESGRTEDVTGAANLRSDNESVVKVDEGNNEIEAVGDGTTEVTATFEGANQKVTINVTDPEGESDGKIEDWEDLHSVRNDLDGSFFLTNDLNENTDGYGEFVPAGDGWEPIGNVSNEARFNGTLDGNGHTISGLEIDREGEEYVGLFADLAGQVTDLTVEDADISADGRIGVIAGRLDNGSIKNVAVDGTVSADRLFVGGIVGQNGGTFVEPGTIEDALADVDVNAKEVFFGVGGAVGWSEGDVIGVRAEGDVVGGDKAVGGLVGLFNDAGDGEIRESSAHGDVKGSNQVGGLVGDNEHVIEDSYATGNVTGDSNVGGAIGRNAGETTKLFATGKVTGNSNVGGLAGTNTVVDTFGGPGGIGELNDSYWDIDGTGQDAAAGSNDSEIENVEGLSTDEMQGDAAEDNLDAFDFDNIWETTDEGYPELQ